MDKTIGACSLCGGNVVTHTGPWAGLHPPEQKCSKCGGRPAERSLPVIEMEIGQAVFDGFKLLGVG